MKRALFVLTVFCLGCEPKLTPAQAQSTPVKTNKKTNEKIDITKTTPAIEVASGKGKMDPNPTPSVPAHLVCETSSDCLVVTGECGLNRLGNKAEEKAMEAQYAKYVEEMRADKKRECSKIVPPLRSVGCLEKRCLMWPYQPNTYAKKSCASADDCAVVKGICGQFEVVHADNAEHAAKTYAKANSMKDCALMTDPKPTPRCEQKTCVPVLTRPILERLNPGLIGKPLPKSM